jgi:hypothetical protein
MRDGGGSSFFKNKKLNSRTLNSGYTTFSIAMLGYIGKKPMLSATALTCVLGAGVKTTYQISIVYYILE